jgi:hypothetical protein
MHIDSDLIGYKSSFYNSTYSLGYDKHFIVTYNEPSVTINPQSKQVYTAASDPALDTLTCEAGNGNNNLAMPLTPVTMPINTPITNPIRYVYN